MRPRHFCVPRLLSWIVLVSLGSGQTAWSQVPDSTAVRSATFDLRLIGRLQEVTADSLILVQRSDRRAISRAQVLAFERWSGTGSAVGRDALRGLGIGAWAFSVVWWQWPLLQVTNAAAGCSWNRSVISLLPQGYSARAPIASAD